MGRNMDDKYTLRMTHSDCGRSEVDLEIYLR